jgi:hypothetical protein
MTENCSFGIRFPSPTQAMNNTELRLQDMEEAGFDIEILTFSAPSVDIFRLEAGENLAWVVNDELAQICRSTYTPYSHG